MNTLVVYDSQFGNTHVIAEAIAEQLRLYGPARACHVDPAQPCELEDVDLLILGCPTQGWRPTQAMCELVAHAAPHIKRGAAVAYFDTRFHKPHWLTGSAAQSIAKRLHAVGIEPLVPPESFFVEQTQGPLEAGEEARGTVGGTARGAVRRAASACRHRVGNHLTVSGAPWMGIPGSTS